MPASTLVGIAGGDGSGKTEVASRLQETLGADKVLCIRLGSYYKEVPPTSQAARRHFDLNDPNSIDISLLVSHLASLKSGRPVQKLDYDRASLRRIVSRELLHAKPIILIEGSLVLAIPSVRSLLDVKIFVDTAADFRFIRHYRDVTAALTWSFDEIARQYEVSVRPIHFNLVEPSKDYADLILPLNRPNDRGAEMLLSGIASLVATQPARSVISKVDGAERLLVPEGEFLMGSTENQIVRLMREYGAEINWFNDERPAHIVKLPSFYIDKYPVTNERYAEFLKQTGYDAPETWGVRGFDQPEQPVVGASWQDALTYCNWAGKRLPTEAEWEKAARGVNARLYPWGEEKPEGRANFSNKHGGPTKVGAFAEGASPYGVMDMAGNVWEWVNDWYDNKYYSHSPSQDPKGPQSSAGRIVRGGCWINNPTMIRCAERDYRRLPHTDLRYFGFRCAHDLG